VAAGVNKHSSICPASETLIADDCVCVYIEAERERIINLIGDKFECVQHYDCEPLINITCSEMYALIKGE
jgi:hypothetical protein